jgi:hypothetical protein
VWQQSVVSVAGRQAACELGGEAVILDLDSGIYYGLDEVGAVAWDVIRTAESPANLGSLCAAVEARFEVSHETCERDLIELLTELERAGLVEVRSGAPE